MVREQWYVELLPIALCHGDADPAFVRVGVFDLQADAVDFHLACRVLHEGDAVVGAGRDVAR